MIQHEGWAELSIKDRILRSDFLFSRKSPGSRQGFFAERIL